MVTCQQFYSNSKCKIHTACLDSFFLFKVLCMWLDRNRHASRGSHGIGKHPQRVTGDEGVLSELSLGRGPNTQQNSHPASYSDSWPCWMAHTKGFIVRRQQTVVEQTPEGRFGVGNESLACLWRNTDLRSVREGERACSCQPKAGSSRVS